MDIQFWLEMVGYAGSILVAISLTMKSLLRLRIINLVGALVFVIYGFLIGAYPVALLNGLIVGIDLYYLVQMWRQKDYFTLLEVAHDSAYLNSLLAFYRDEIADIFPDYSFMPNPQQLTVFVLRNMVPAGVLIVLPNGEQAQVLLDYVIPGYRDFQIGRFLFDENAAYFAGRGIHSLVADAGKPRHTHYLERMGFQRGEGGYVRKLGGRIVRDTAL